MEKYLNYSIKYGRNCCIISDISENEMSHIKLIILLKDRYKEIWGMSENIIDMKSNFVYQVIYSVQDKKHGLKFPVEKIEQYLSTEGYNTINLETYKSQIVMTKDCNRVLIGEKSICFEVLSEEFKEKYNQKISSFVILRYKIFSDATIQNIESAKINLIQNKLRTCVSNMYYSLHNGISAMVEYYKLMNDNNLLDFINEELDDEAFLGHFTPSAFKVFLSNIDDICEKDKDEYLKRDELKSGRMKSYNNPFSWIFPLFYDKIINIEDENNEIGILLEDVAAAVKEISLDNIGVDDTQKRSNFEKELKLSLEIVKDIITTEEKNSTKYILAVLAGYFSYAYMLRQLGDYDSLFEIKVKPKDVIRWTITSSQFVDIILKYQNIRVNDNENKIQIINARSSKEILSGMYSETEMDLITITGVIIDRNFRLDEYVKRLLKKQGYSLFNQFNEIPNYDESSSEIMINKNIVTTPYKCFVSISKTGIFRIDVTLSNNNDMRIKKTINTSYLEKFIHKEILDEDFQKLLSDKGNIVVGTPIIYQNEEYSKLELAIKTHELLEHRYYRRISNILDKVANELYNKKVLIIPINNVFREEDRIYIGSIRMRFDRSLRQQEGFDSNVHIIFIILSNGDVSKSQDNIELTINAIKRNITINNSFEVRYIKVSEENLKQMLYGDDSDIKNSFKSIIERYEDSEGQKELLDSLSEEDDYCDTNPKNIDELDDIAITSIENELD